jgi:hypothetical protein
MRRKVTSQTVQIIRRSQIGKSLTMTDEELAEVRQREEDVRTQRAERMAARLAEKNAETPEG